MARKALEKSNLLLRLAHFTFQTISYFFFGFEEILNVEMRKKNQRNI